MNTLLVDDHQMMLDGIQQLLQREFMDIHIDQATTIESAKIHLARKEYQIVITDYNLPDGDGLQLIQSIKTSQSSAKVLMLSMHDEGHLVKEILKSGVNGYILKKDSQSELIAGIKSTLAGKLYLSRDINTILVNELSNNSPKLLSTREREILELIAKEYSNKKIADELFISERTVETHRKNIFRKTKTNSLVGLIKFAYANKLI
ncbi:response regulator transcription factor [Reichenbachiella agarivorans]|uniref:Response regulator transcription factor n=1 Tax=Reichenbachiella agarivorans TaxID=2979464 RepID=A0ABY6CVS7_9BACT|nr:response regulator transcription factor [Reichenbachiella agarivorans]UXP34034.1 response regulator transcription factor [Reichenbachiella agarivorans]